MVEVEERRLRALEQHVLSRLERVVHEADGVRDEGRDPGRQLVEVARGDVLRRQRQPVVDLREDRVLLLEHDVELLAEDLRIEQVLHAETRAQRLVRVRRTDAALRRAELVLSQPTLGERVELLVVREDQMRVAAHEQPAAVDALLSEPVELREQHRGVDHDAVADDRRDVVVEDAARHQLQSERLTADDDRVPGVVPALVADDDLHLLGDEVGELALALVAPLRADHDRCGHPGDGTEPGRGDADARPSVPLSHRGSPPQ